MESLAHGLHTVYDALQAPEFPYLELFLSFSLVVWIFHTVLDVRQLQVVLIIPLVVPLGSTCC